MLATLSRWLRQRFDKQVGIPYEEFDSTIEKCRHMFTSVPAGNGLMSPCNAVCRLNPKFVWLHKNPDLRLAIKGMRTIIRETASTPTPCRELIQGWPDYGGVKDASKYGVGGVIIGENEACIPTVFRYQWPDDIMQDVVSEVNPTGRLTNSDLEMAGLLFLWLIMEEV